MTEDKMFGWHHQLNGHEFEHAMGDGEGKRSLERFSPRGHKDSGMTEQLNNNNSHYSRTRNVRNQRRNKTDIICILYDSLHRHLLPQIYRQFIKNYRREVFFIIYSVTVTSWILLYSA